MLDDQQTMTEPPRAIVSRYFIAELLCRIRITVIKCKGDVRAHVIHSAPCVGPGKSHLPFELRRKAGDCSRVTAGPIGLI